MYDVNKKKIKRRFRWVDNPDPDIIGEYLFTFDGEHIYNLFQDYPYALTKEEKEEFDRLNPFWVDFFKDRTK